MPTFSRIIPVLVYDDLHAAHAFLVDVFGFTAGLVQRDGAGKPVHAEVCAGETTIWLHRATPEHELASPCTLGAVGSGGLVIQVDDVDEHYRRVRAHAAAKIDGPAGRSSCRAVTTAASSRLGLTSVRRYARLRLQSSLRESCDRRRASLPPRRDRPP